MQNTKEKLSNVVTDAKAGLEKAKAGTQEKVERMVGVDKRTAEERERARKAEAEMKAHAEKAQHSAQHHTAAGAGGEGFGGLAGGTHNSTHVGGHATPGTHGGLGGHGHGLGGLTGHNNTHTTTTTTTGTGTGYPTTRTSDYT